ncbi:hypothetical protein [Enterococcus cecorum]|uniref:hypothetical protein n=1 Tax=Enterococcus cecorum TaxID=44008 RepID=UPI000E07025F|nr:hypothetical protein [Enterococcus cecorum]RBR36063.1 hypothetical protein EB26_00885 [Enterococcus cecorum]
MKTKKYEIEGATLHLTDLRAMLSIEGPTSFSSITFDKNILQTKYSTKGAKMK